jgi:hypothetical protein
MSLTRKMKDFRKYTQKFLWWASLLGTIFFLINARTCYKTHEDIDQYFNALRKGDREDAAYILQKGLLDEINGVYGYWYFHQHLQEPMSPEMIQCGLDTSATIPTWSMGDDDFSHFFYEKGAKPTERTLTLALRSNQVDRAVDFLASGIKGEGVFGEDSPIKIVIENIEVGDYFRCLPVLITHKVDLNKTNCYGATPLHFLVQKHMQKGTIHSYRGGIYQNENCLFYIKMMLDNGAHPNVKNKEGVTPLYTAALNQDVNCVELLLENGADPNISWYAWAKKRSKKSQAFAPPNSDRAKILHLLERYGAK